MIAADLIEGKCRDIVGEQLGIPSEDVKQDSKFIEDLGCDSLDLVELALSAEDEFDTEFPDEELATCITFGQAVELIKKHIVAE